MLISKQTATSTKENQAVIVQEDQDEHFRDKIEEYKLFLEMHPDYYDDGLTVDDENQSCSEPDDIAQPK